MSGLLLPVGDWLLTTAVDVTLLVGALLVVERLLGARLGPTTRYLLWSLVLLRLLMPALPADPLGLKTAAPAAPAEATTTEPVGLDATPATVRAPLPLPPPRAARPQGQPALPEPVAAATDDRGIVSGGAATGAGASRETRRVRPPAPRRNSPASAAALTTAAPADTKPQADLFPWRAMLLGIWAAGVLALVTRLAVLEFRFRRALARDRRPAPVRLTAALETARREGGLRRPVEAVLTDAVPAPAVAGVWRPRLLMSPAALARLDEEELHHVLAHEVAHLRAGDPLLRWLIALAGALHWFHPFARLALRRVQESQEVLRDFQALGRRPGADPGGYAGTLLKLGTPPPRPQPVPLSALLEDGKTLKRRIQMIVDFPLHKRSALLGALLIAAVAWGGLTAASTPASTAIDPDSGTLVQEPGTPGVKTRHVRVVRRDPIPEWKAEMLQKLQAPVELLPQNRLQDVLEVVREATGLNVVLDQDADDDDNLNLQVSGRNAAQLLDLACEVTDLRWGLAPDVVLVDWGSPSTWDHDLRFYSVRELLAQGEDLEDEIDRLQDVLYVSGHSIWDTEHASMRYFNGLLVVHQTDRGHAAVQRTLDLLLNRGSLPAQAPSAQRAALERKLDQTLDVNFQDAEWSEVVAYLSQVSEVPIYLSPDQDNNLQVTLKLQGMSVRDVLHWVARQTYSLTLVEEDMVRFVETPPTEVRVYEVADLLNTDRGQGFNAENELIELVNSALGEQAWFAEDASVQIWHGLLVIRQTPTVHEAIGAFLGALRTAL